MLPGLPTHAQVADRVLGHVMGPQPGPTLVCVGGMHGNEPAGVQALLNVFTGLRGAGIVQGDLAGLAGNLSALAAGRRFVGRDLNRCWDGDGNGAASERTDEDREQQELLDAFGRLAQAARGRVHVLDLHTTSGPGSPFTVFGDTLGSRRFARTFPCPLILGLEEHVEGTMIDYLAGAGHVAAAFEGGQHADPEAVANLEAAVWIALERLDMLDASHRPRVTQARRRLRHVTRHTPAVLEIHYRHLVTDGDGFQMASGFATFDRVHAGQPLARDRTGAVVASETGYLVMPLYQDQGEDGFFIAKRVNSGWLVLSRLMRTARLDRIVHWLPGVRRDPREPSQLVVNRRIARVFALEVLHLLGFRRVRSEPNRLIVRRRRNDRP